MYSFVRKADNPWHPLEHVQQPAHQLHSKGSHDAAINSMGLLQATLRSTAGISISTSGALSCVPSVARAAASGIAGTVP